MPDCQCVEVWTCSCRDADLQSAEPDRKVMERGAWSRGRASEMATASELLVLDLEVRPIFRLVAFY